MNNKKIAVRLFTVADYEEAEIWLSRQHKNGWRFLKVISPCVFVFEKCEPEEVAYRLDFHNNKETADYFQMFSDYGWEYICRCIGWLYFRRPLDETASGQDGEIFSDNESRFELADRIMKTRIGLLSAVLLLNLPNIFRLMYSTGTHTSVISVIALIIVLSAALLLFHCFFKLNKLKKKYKKNE